MLLDEVVREAISIRERHFAIGRPMLKNWGFKEANLVQDVSFVLRQREFYAFPEFPFKRGSIDAVFIRKNEVVICEWKRLSPRSIRKLSDQTRRMMQFDPQHELPKHEFAARHWKVRRLWVCDTWFPQCVDWWRGKTSGITCPRPFAATWKCGSRRIQNLPQDWDAYWWLWAACNQ